MSRKYTKRMKRQQIAQRELLEKLVKAHGQWEMDREESYRELPSYDPEDGYCDDKDLGDKDEKDYDYAFDAQNTFEEFAAEARKILEEESK